MCLTALTLVSAPYGSNPKMAGVDLGAFLRLDAVMALTGLKKSVLYELMRRPEDPFPKPFRIAPKCVAWSEAEVKAWMASRRRALEEAA